MVNLAPIASAVDRARGSAAAGISFAGAGKRVLPHYVITPIFAFSMPGAPEILLILVIVLVLFGAKRLPELARGLGQSMNEFRKAREEFESEIHKTAQATDPKAPAAPATPAKPLDEPKA